MKKRPLLFLVLLLVATVGSVQFIRANNDHRECDKRFSRTVDASGRTVTSEEHHCKEWFPF